MSINTRRVFLRKIHRSTTSERKTVISNMQHNQVDRAEPLPECIEKYTLSSITLNHITNAICSVECYPDLQMCITNNDGKFHFYLDGFEPTFIHDPHSAQIMPTYHQIEDIVRDMDPDSYVKLQWENGYVNYYDYSGILRIKELILCKMIKDIMAEGRTFLSQSDIHAPVMLTNRINKENLQQFWTLLNEHKPNSILKLNDKVLSYNSLLSLMLPDSCLTEGILNHFSSMLNKDAKRNCTLVANYDEVKGNLTEFITQIKLTFGEDLLDVSIILYVNIDGHDVQSSVSESDLQSEPKHYVYAIYRVEANQVLYIDAFARPIPRLFRTFLIQLSKILGNGILYFGSYLEESSYVDQKKNICKSILPFTGCEAVGGISVVIGMLIFALDKKLFQILSNQDNGEELNKEGLCLKDISDNVHVFRLLLIDWIMKGDINLSLIYMCAQEEKICIKSVNTNRSASSCVPSPSVIDINSYAGDSERIHNCTLDCRIDKDGGNDIHVPPLDLDNEVVTSSNIIIQTPDVNLNKNYIYDRNMKLMQNEMFLRVQIGQNYVSISYNEVSHLLVSPPCIKFIEKDTSYCVECNLVDSGVRYISFKCSPNLRRDDEGVFKQITEFFTLKNFQRWLNDSKITVENEQYISHLHLGAASGKYSEDFDPELIIVLHDSPHEFSSPKDVNVSRNLKCKRVIPKTRNVSFLQSFPADNLEEPVSADVNMESLHTKDLYEPQGGYEVSSANTIKVGCSQGRIPVYFGEIKDLIIGRPIIAFRKKKCCYSFTCTFHTGDAAYKNFSCKKDKGRDDYNALKQINTFLKVKNFTLWMKENLKIKQKNKRRNASVDHPSKNVKRTSRRENLAQYLRQIGREDIILLENDTLPNQISDETAHICMEIGNNGTVSKSVTCREKNLQGIKMLSSSSINYDNIKECIVGKPKVHYIKAKNLYRLECLLWNGGKIHKHFACLPSERAKVLHDIQTFLNGDEAALWVKNYDDGWIFQYEVKAGADTRERLDKLTFDVTKHFIYNRKVVKPEYFKETCWVSVTENVKWGKTHRYDETYRLLKPSNTLDPNTIVAYVYLNCASKTNECRAACGPLLSSLTTCDGVCGNCGLSLASGRQCYNCKSTSSSQWYTKGEPGALCASCYTYRQRKGFHRHLEQKASTNKNVNKIHHSHLKCNWKMKLEMKLNNLNVWNVYEASENIRCHRTTPVQRQKKPALGTRDMWDKLRISRKSSSLQIHSSENKCKISDCFDEDNHPIHTLSQVKGRCELVDRHHSVKSSEGEPCCTALNVVEKEPMFQDTGKAVKAEMQLHFKETIGNHTRICGLCFEKGVSPPFTCISKRDLDAHKNKMHNSYGDLCGLCYKEHDVVVKFEDSRELSMHLNKHKSKCS